MANYFEGIETIETLKKAYTKLVKQLHPDNGGDAEAFKEMQSQYRDIFKVVKDNHISSEGKRYTKESTEEVEEFMDIIEKFIHVPGIEVELCGRWLWISGNTKPVHEELKALGCHWCNKKKMWNWHRPEDAVRRHKKTMSIQEIRFKYGSQSFKDSDDQMALEA